MEKPPPQHRQAEGPDSLVGTMVKIKADTDSMVLCRKGRSCRDRGIPLLVVDDYSFREPGIAKAMQRWLTLSWGHHSIKVALAYTMSSET